jgi:hypothetical protein
MTSEKGVGFMDEFGCDYTCRTVGESITKYNIPADWRAEFDVHDGAYPIISIPVDQIRQSPAMMALKLRIVENPDDEYAGCMVFAETKTIIFKVDHMRDLVKAIGLSGEVDFTMQ